MTTNMKIAVYYILTLAIKGSIMNIGLEMELIHGLTGVNHFQLF